MISDCNMASRLYPICVRPDVCAPKIEFGHDGSEFEIGTQQQAFRSQVPPPAQQNTWCLQLFFKVNRMQTVYFMIWLLYIFDGETQICLLGFSILR